MGEAFEDLELAGAMAASGLISMRYSLPRFELDGPAYVDACRHVLGVTGNEGGFEPGQFTKALIDTMLKADKMNWRKLAEVFPELALAVAVFKDVEGGLGFLKAIAKP